MQWEYLVVMVLPELETRQDFLNEVGSDGWELVTVLGNGGAPVAYMKRLKEETE